MKYRIVELDNKYLKQITNFRNELLSCGSTMDGAGSLRKIADPKKWILDCKLYEKIETCPPLMPISKVYLYVDEDDKLVGMIQIRPDAENHPFLSVYGGHIGYCVLPSRRRQGIGTNMLKDILPICKNKFELDKIMISCVEGNIGSRKIILTNGGKFDSKVYYPAKNKNLEHYWISL